MNETTLNWTNEKPKEAGFYSYRPDPQAKRKIVEIVKDGDAFYCLTLWLPAHLELSPGQWAGPIPEPTDATQPHYVDKAVGMDLNEGLK